jgi:hypothetical protein
MQRIEVPEFFHQSRRETYSLTGVRGIVAPSPSIVSGQLSVAKITDHGREIQPLKG